MLDTGKEGARMPWQEQSSMELREEFVQVASQEGVSIRAVCRQYTISPKTAYKWLTRAREGGQDWAADQSRRPHTSPAQTPPAVEAQIVALRQQHQHWGGRKLHHRLRALGVEPVPAPSTITDILRRHDLLDADHSQAHQQPQRFEHPVPNALWQLDFMGHLPMVAGRVHPLTVLDDHSRFALGVVACGEEKGGVVQTHLTDILRRYGLPAAILTDHGPPWGTAGQGGITRVEAWLTQLGIEVWHGRPLHPQTQGKIERLHRTLAIELTNTRRFADLASAQTAFDAWRQTYNLERPHEALAFAVPAARYQPSAVPFPETLPPIEYAPDDLVRTVRDQGAIGFANRSYFISRGLIGQPVAVRPTTTDGVFAVFFCHRQVASIDLTESSKV
jgi:transposase InsO family protein